MARIFKKKIFKALIYITLILLAVVAFAGGREPAAYAATTVEGYSDVLADLKKDPKFDSTEYETDVSSGDIQVIQVAESEAGELFIYTYQPGYKSLKLSATQVNMSLSQSADGTKLYALTLLSNNGVFCKYLVNGVKVSTDNERYYNISSIYRDYIEGVDTATGTDNTKNAVAFEVGKCFRVTGSGASIKYECTEKETITIINPYSDFLRYDAGSSLGMLEYTDSHYVAFSTDKEIDTLLEADLSYYTRSCKEGRAYIGNKEIGHKVEYGEEEENFLTITADDQGFSDFHNFWFTKGEDRYWPRIQSVQDFISSEELKDETKSNLEGKQWVLRFVETPFRRDITNAWNWVYSTDVSNVTILRLKFETDGVVYNLGTVSDVVSDDNIPGNPQPEDNNKSFLQYVWNCIVKLFKGEANIVETIVAVLALMVVFVFIPVIVAVLSALFPVFGQVVLWIVKVLGKLIVYIFKALWWLITLPFRGIKALIDRKGKNEEQDSKKKNSGKKKTENTSSNG